jgi:hypothetical protein
MLTLKNFPTLFGFEIHKMFQHRQVNFYTKDIVQILMLYFFKIAKINYRNLTIMALVYSFKYNRTNTKTKIV